jgi:hypothetical protein
MYYYEFLFFMSNKISFLFIALNLQLIQMSCISFVLPKDGLVGWNMLDSKF